MTAGYEGLTGPEQKWFDELMGMSMGSWPADLQGWVAGQRPTCGDMLADVVGQWVKRQSRRPA
jgi:hypothetical protein